jgi:hypothetical protein
MTVDAFPMPRRGRQAATYGVRLAAIRPPIRRKSSNPYQKAVTPSFGRMVHLMSIRSTTVIRGSGDDEWL